MSLGVDILQIVKIFTLNPAVTSPKADGHLRKPIEQDITRNNATLFSKGNYIHHYVYG
jgi:hypothetical protein